MGVARDRDWAVLWVGLLLLLGQGMSGAMAASQAWRQLSRIVPVRPDGDQAATAVLVANQIQQQTELRLAIGLGIGLVVLILGVAVGIWLAPGYAAAAQLAAVLAELMLIAVSMTRRPLLWSALAVLVATTAVVGFCIWAVIQMKTMD